MKKNILKIGDILQINPSHAYGEMLLIVTEPKSWGAQGYLLSEYEFDAVRYKGRAFLRVKTEDFEKVGRLKWLREEDVDEKDA